MALDQHVVSWLLLSQVGALWILRRCSLFWASHTHFPWIEFPCNSILVGDLPPSPALCIHTDAQLPPVVAPPTPDGPVHRTQGDHTPVPVFEETRCLLQPDKVWAQSDSHTAVILLVPPPELLSSCLKSTLLVDLGAIKPVSSYLDGI